MTLRTLAFLLALLVTIPAASIEQTAPGARAAATLVRSFDGLGLGFEGPQGSATFRNPSDNSLAVGPNHVVQIVNSRMAIYTKEGKPLYGPVLTNTVFKDFGGACEASNNGDAVVRYDQLASRWLVVMPVFRRGAVRPDQPQLPKAGEPAQQSVPGRPGQPGPAAKLFIPAPAAAPAAAPQRGQGAPRGEAGPQGPYSMCYAISYSFGGIPNFAGQRFAGRLANDPLGQLTLKEALLVEGEGAQNGMRWQDYTQTAVDPVDDCTIWYVGDYIRRNETAYSSKIGAFRMPGCQQ
jgi:hypothetical protein